MYLKLSLPPSYCTLIACGLLFNTPPARQDDYWLRCFWCFRSYSVRRFGRSRRIRWHRWSSRCYRCSGYCWCCRRRRWHRYYITRRSRSYITRRFGSNIPSLSASRCRILCCCQAILRCSLASIASGLFRFSPVVSSYRTTFRLSCIAVCFRQVIVGIVECLSS